MIKAIIFDCFGVLTTDIWLSYCESLPPTADVERARELNRAFDAGLITHTEFFDQVEEATGTRPPDVDVLKSGEIIKNDELIKYIRELKKTYKLGVLSNISSDWITREFLTADEQALFDEIVLSYQVGLLKPNYRIYELVCEKLGVEPHEAIMVDDRADFVSAAKSTGLQGITYQNMARFKVELEELLNTNQ